MLRRSERSVSREMISAQFVLYPHSCSSKSPEEKFSLVSSRARSDFRTPLASLHSIIFFLTSFCVDSIHSISCNKRSLQTFHEEWKGRIDPWQPRRKRRRKAARSTKQAATEQRNGDAMSVPKVFWKKRSGGPPAARLRSRVFLSPETCDLTFNWRGWRISSEEGTQPSPLPDRDCGTDTGCSDIHISR